MGASEKNSTSWLASPSDSQEARAGIVIFGPVDVWTPENAKMLRENLKGVKIIECSDFTELANRTVEFDISIILCQARTDEELGLCFSAIAAAKNPVSVGLSTVALITPDLEHPQVTLFEKKGLVQALKSSITAKALRIKLDLFLSRLKGAHKDLKQKYPADYRIKIPASGNRSEETAVIFDESSNPDRSSIEQGVSTSTPSNRDDLLSVNSEPQESRLPSESEADSSAMAVTVSETPKPAAETAPRITLVEDVFDHLVLISSRSEDLVLAAKVSAKVRMNFHVFQQASPDILQFMARYPGSLVFWDVDHADAEDSKNPSSVENVGLMLSKSAEPCRVVTISDQAINCFPYLFNYSRQAFTNNIQRRDNPAALEIYSCLVENILSKNRFGLEQFFKGGSKRQEITLSTAAHRVAAIEATRGFLVKQGVPPRLGGQVGHAVEELLLNAIFDAPIDASHERYRLHADRMADFSFSKKETVTLSIMSNDEYIGVAVTDQFGSLNLNEVLAHLSRNYRTEDYLSEKSDENGLGLNNVVESGFSLLLSTVPGESTDAILFFPKARNHKEFKTKFKFLSVVRQK